MSTVLALLLCPSPPFKPRHQHLLESTQGVPSTTPFTVKRSQCAQLALIATNPLLIRFATQAVRENLENMRHLKLGGGGWGPL